MFILYTPTMNESMVNESMLNETLQPDDFRTEKLVYMGINQFIYIVDIIVQVMGIFLLTRVKSSMGNQRY